MAALLITYDLNSPGQNHKEVLEKIKTYPWVKLSESSYAIKTNETPQDVYSLFQSLLDSNDNLLIITLTNPWYGKASQEVLNWLKSVL